MSQRTRYWTMHWLRGAATAEPCWSSPSPTNSMGWSFAAGSAAPTMP